MAKTTASAQYEIIFKQKGLDRVESDLSKFATHVHGLMKDAIDFKLPDLTPKLKQYEKELATVAEKINALRSDYMADAAAGVLDSSQIKKYNQEFSNLTTRYAKLKADITSVQQAIRSTANGTISSIEANVAALKKYDAVTPGLEKAEVLLKDLQATLSKPGGVDQLRSVNRELEKEIGYAEKLKQAYDAIDKIKASTAAKSKLKDRVYSTEEFIAKPGVSYKEKDIAIQKLQKEAAEIQKINDYQEKLRQKIISMNKELGLSSAEAKKLATELQKTADNAFTTKSVEGLQRMDMELKKISGNLKKTSAEYESMFVKAENAANKFAATLDSSLISKNKNISESLNKLTGKAIGKLTSGEVIPKGELANMENLFSTLTKITPKLDQMYVENKRLIKSFEGYGLAAGDVKKLEAELEKILIESAKTGNINFAKQFTADIKEMDKMLAKSTETLKTLEGTNIKMPGPTKEQVAAWQQQVEGAKKLDAALLRLERRYAEQVGSLERMIEVKKRWANPADIKKAEAELTKFKQKLQEIQAVQNNLRTQMASGTVNTSWVSSSLAAVDKYNHSLESMKIKAKEVKAEISKLDPTRWAVNVFKRAWAYAGMYAGIYQVITALGKGVDATIEFDKAQRTIAAVFDVNSEKAKELESRLIGLGKAWGGSMKDINEAALSLGRAGIESDKLVKATEVVMKMAKLTGDTIQTSASALITYQQVFGDTGKTLQQFGDQLAYVANQSRLSTQDIGTYSNYALAAAKASGLTMEAVNAMATAFSNAGVNASTIGTQIRRFSSLLKDNSTATQEFFQKIGLSQKLMAVEFAKGGEASDRALKKLVLRLKEISDQDFRKVIAGMDILAAQSITLLRNNADQFLAHFKNLKEGVDGELAKADQIAQSHEAVWQKLAITASESFAKMAEQLTPVIETAVKSLTQVLQFLQDNSKEVAATAKTAFTLMGTYILWVAGGSVIGKLIGGLKAVREAMIAITAIDLLGGIGKIGSALTSVVAGAKRLATVVGSVVAIEGVVAGAGTLVAGLGRALMSLAGGPLGIVLGLGSAAYALYEYFKDDEEQAVKTGKTIESAFARSAKAIKELDASLRKQREELVELVAKAKEVGGAEKEALEKQIALKVRDIEITKEQRKALEEKQKVIEEQVKLAELEAQKKQYQIIIDATLADNSIDAELQQKLVSGYKKAIERINTQEHKVKLAIDRGEVDQQIRAVERRLAELDRNKRIYAKTPAKDVYMKIFNKQIEDNMKQLVRLKKLKETLYKKDTGNKPSFDIATKNDIKELTQLRKSIVAMLKAGFPVDEALKYFETRYRDTMSRIANGTAASLEESLTYIGNAIAEKSVEAGQKYREAMLPIMQELKEAAQTEDPNEMAAKLNDVMIKLMQLKNMNVVRDSGMSQDISALMGDLNRIIDMIYTAKSQAVTLGATATSAAANQIKGMANSVKSEISQILKEYNSGLAISRDRINRIFTDYNNMMVQFQNKAAQMAKQMAAQIEKPLEDLKKKFESQGNKAGVQAVENLKKALKDVANGKAGPEAVDRAVKELDTQMQTAKITAVELQSILGNLGAQMGYIFSAMSSLSSAAAKFGGAISIPIPKGWTELPSILQKGAAAAAKAGSSQKKLQYQVKLAGEAYAKAKIALKGYNNSTVITKKQHDEATGAIKKADKAGQGLTNTLGRMAAGLGGAGGAAKSTANAIDELRKKIAELKGESTWQWDFQSEQQSVAQTLGINLDNLKAASQEKLDLYYQWLDAYTQNHKVQLIQMGSDMATGGPLQDESGFAADVSGIAPEYQAELQKIAAFYTAYEAQVRMGMEKVKAAVAEGKMSEAEAREQLNGMIEQIEAAHTQRTIMEQKAQFDSYLAYIQTGLGQISGMLNDLIQAGYIKSKRAFEFYKALKVAEAIISTYAAASQIFADPTITSPFLKYALMAIAIARGMVNVAMIKAQRMPAPRYHTGGYAGTAQPGAVGGLRDDEIPAILQKGEYVLSKRDVDMIKSINIGAPAVNVQPAQTEVVIINSVDDSVMEQWAESRTGREVIRNVVNQERTS